MFSADSDVGAAVWPGAWEAAADGAVVPGWCCAGFDGVVGLVACANAGAAMQSTAATATGSLIQFLLIIALLESSTIIAKAGRMVTGQLST